MDINTMVLSCTTIRFICKPTMFIYQYYTHSNLLVKTKTINDPNPPQTPAKRRRS